MLSTVFSLGEKGHLRFQCRNVLALPTTTTATNDSDDDDVSHHILVDALAKDCALTTSHPIYTIS